MIGFSFSECIRDIISGKAKLEEVEKIYTLTACRSDEDWNLVIIGYMEHCWTIDPIGARTAALELLSTGKIIQPRLSFMKVPDRTNGIWAKDETEIVWLDISFLELILVETEKR